MPNWCSNSLTVLADPTGEVGHWVAAHTDENGEIGELFGALLPLPVALEGVHRGWSAACDSDRWREVRDPETGERVSVAVTGAEREQLVAQYGAADWYEWSCQNWGTKWDASTVPHRDERGRLRLTFDTAWAPPRPWALALSARFPRAVLELAYSEAGMGYAGTEQMEAGEVTMGGEWTGRFHTEDEDGEWVPVPQYADFLEAHGLWCGG